MNMSQFAIPRKCDIPINAYAVWQIPELDIVIPLYQAKNKVEAQNQVDEKNSASIYKFGVGRTIADHANSKAGTGKWDVGQFKPDMLGFMIFENGKIDKYICNQVCRVKVCSGGYTLDGMGVYPKKVTDIMCVSCANSKGTENYLAIFKYVGETI